jgi:hypothetical protein
MNSKMIKSGIVVLIRREKADIDVVVSWMLQPAAGALVGKSKREN